MQQVATERKEASITYSLTSEIFQLVMTDKERKKENTGRCGKTMQMSKK